MKNLMIYLNKSDISKYITIIECPSIEYTLSFVTNKYVGDNVKETKPRFFEHTPRFTITKFTKTFSLIETDLEKIQENFIQKISQLVDKQDNRPFRSIVKWKTDDKEDIYIYRALQACINNSSAYINYNGGNGMVTNMIISKSNYDIFSKEDHSKLSDLVELNNINVLFDESVYDLFLYRKNDYNQSGIVLLYCEDKYLITEIGYPEHLYTRIKLPI